MAVGHHAGGLVGHGGNIGETSGQIPSRLMTFLRRQVDDSLGHRVESSLAAAAGLGLKAKPQLFMFQPDM